MDYIDVILDELKTTDNDVVNEGWFLTTPFVAYASLKKKMFDKILKNKAFEVIRDVASGKISAGIKSKYIIGKEKIKHEVGLKSGDDKDATVYKLTPEQISVMAEIYDKYGDEIIEEIYVFRKNILAPYQAIKRAIKKNKQISFKDVNGLSYEEYKSALESGRKKILKRKDFFERGGEKLESADKYSKSIDRMKEAKKELLSGKSAFNDSLLNRVYQEFEVSDEDLGGYSAEDMKAITDELASNFTKLSKYANSPSSTMPPSEVLDTIERNIQLRSGSRKENGSDIKEIVKNLNRENIKKGNFKLAFSKYMFRKEIQNSIRSKDDNSFKKIYLDLIDETIKKMEERKSETIKGSVSSKMSIEFNDKESKIWELLPSVKNEYSGKLEDYYQKITDSKYKDVVHIKKPEGLEQNQQEIENEIKRFERRLTQIIDKEDVEKLKKYRLINNLITIRDLEDPSQMFKDQNELKADKPAAAAGEENKEAENKESYVSEDEFNRRLKEYATMEFDTMAELNNSKKQVDSLVARMKEQGDDDIVEKYSNMIRQIKERRTTEQQKVHGTSYTFGEILTINDIEQFAKNMIKKSYKNFDETKQDKIMLDKMIKKYKSEEPEAERNLDEIDFLLKQVDRKLQGELGQYLGSKSSGES